MRNPTPFTSSWNSRLTPSIRATPANSTSTSPPWTPKIKAPDDNSTIGLLRCKTRNHLVAEYALSGIGKPIGIAEYQLVRALPEPLDTCLPSIEQIEAELGRIGESD